MNETIFVVDDEREIADLVAKDKSYKIVNVLALAATILLLAIIGLLLSRTIIYTVAPH